MLQGYCLLWINWVRYAIWQLCNLWVGLTPATLRNLALLCLGLPISMVFLHVHWLFLLIDEVLFFGYRHVSVDKPVFVLGVPRSGTTFLQRTLSQDPQFTTTTLEECLLTPSISQRYIARAIKQLCAPLVKILPNKRSKFSRKMESVHPLGMAEAEEDFLLLLPVLSCFIQMVVFPNHAKTWHLAYFDQQLSDWQRRAIIEFYYRLVQRHLYYHGRDKIYLSKNPSFTSLVESLKLRFPGATVIACVRTPKEAVPSQLRSLEPAFELLGHDINEPLFVRRVSSMLAHYYSEIERWSRDDDTLFVLQITELNTQLFVCLSNLYRAAGLTMSGEIQAEFERLAEQNKSFRSQHEGLEQAPVGFDAKLFEHLWPLSGSNQLISFTENT